MFFIKNSRDVRSDEVYFIGSNLICKISFYTLSHERKDPDVIDS